MPDAGLSDDRLHDGQREPRNPVDPSRPYAFLVEPERTAEGSVEDVATVFITNKECPYRCVFCDLWRNATRDRVRPGVVADQVEWALGRLAWAPHVKLYNSGNFFDEQAIPRADRPRIARLVADRRTLIVECHPKLVDARCLDFADSLDPRLEVAMGLETVDPNVLPRLNKSMTLDDFERAADSMVSHAIRVRAFILLPAPFQSVDQGVTWAIRSVRFAFSVGVECCAIIPLRWENGPMHAESARNDVPSPTIAALETVLEEGIRLGRGRVLADLWDIERLAGCPLCGPRRIERLSQINFSQTIPPRITCDCGA